MGVRGILRVVAIDTSELWICSRRATEHSIVSIASLLEVVYNNSGQGKQGFVIAQLTLFRVMEQSKYTSSHYEQPDDQISISLIGEATECHVCVFNSPNIFHTHVLFLLDFQ